MTRMGMTAGVEPGFALTDKQTGISTRSFVIALQHRFLRHTNNANVVPMRSGAFFKHF